MRLSPCATLSPLLCAGLEADGKKAEKIDPQKLVGKWFPMEAAVFTIESAKDRKVKLVATTGDGKVKAGEGTYFDFSSGGGIRTHGSSPGGSS
jgi:uncharacterized protein (TIGR03066 family)